MITTLSQLVALVESGDNPHALRYEPGFDKYVLPATIKKIIAAHKPAYMNTTTARELLKFSYGRYQIMGENIYSLGYQGTIAAFLNDDMAQLTMFSAFIRSRNINYSLAHLKANEMRLKEFARKYNGSVAYAETLRKHWG